MSICKKEKDSQHISYTLHENKNELKIDHRSKCRAQNNKTLKEKIGENLIYFEFDDKFLDTIPKMQSTKEKN